MELTEQSDTRLVLTQKRAEMRWIALLGTVFFLGMGAYFYWTDDRDARIYAYLFGGAGVLFAALMFVKPVGAQVLFDTATGDMVLRVPRGTSRKVTVVPLDQIAAVKLLDVGTASTGHYQQVEFTMTEASGIAPIRLPSNFSGMSQAMIHDTITDWARRHGAFPNANVLQ